MSPCEVLLRALMRRVERLTEFEGAAEKLADALTTPPLALAPFQPDFGVHSA